jgi:hypothetical protein
LELHEGVTGNSKFSLKAQVPVFLKIAGIPIAMLGGGEGS